MNGIEVFVFLYLVLIGVNKCAIVFCEVSVISLELYDYNIFNIPRQKAGLNLWNWFFFFPQKNPLTFHFIFSNESLT